MGISKAHKRELFRIAIDRSGYVQKGAERAPCYVENLTEKGFQLRVEGSFARGDILHLEFALAEQDFLACTVQVTYARPPLLGTLIASISAHHRTALSDFIKEVNTINLAGF